MSNFTIKLNEAVEYTVEYILNKVSEQQILEFYNGGESIKGNQLMLCKFHKDSNPSLGFYRTKYGKIRYNCFSCGSTGGAIDYVMRVTGLGFKEAIKDIIDNLVPITKNVVSKEREISTPAPSLTHIEFKAFELTDSRYWGQYGLSLEDVLFFNIKAISRFFYKKKDWEKFVLWNSYSKDRPLYGFFYGEGVKVYSPYSKDRKLKWFQTSAPNSIQGLESLNKKGDILFITSSLKDCMVLYKLGYSAIAPNSESQKIEREVLESIKSKYNKTKIVYFNDSDGPGYNYTLKNLEEGDNFIFIPRYYKEKDISDYVKSYGVGEAGELVKRLLKWKKIVS